ncbi:MAG: DsbA family protein [Hyphomicrobiales bacterium]
MLIIAILAVIVGAITYTVIKDRSGLELKGPQTAIAAESVDMAELSRAGGLNDMIMGSKNAPVTMIEYASLICHRCAEFDTEILPGLKRKYITTGRMRLIFREFAFDDLALAGFMIARCAPEDKYFPLIDTMFKRQQVWLAATADPRTELFKIARLSGMTKQSFNACLKNETLAREINKVYTHAEKKLGIEGVPTFFINGQVLVGNQPLERFESVINTALAKASNPPTENR